MSAVCLYLVIGLLQDQVRLSFSFEKNRVKQNLQEALPALQTMSFLLMLLSSILELCWNDVLNRDYAACDLASYDLTSIVSEFNIHAFSYKVVLT